jgi:dTDP-4-dehydrorhamnose 3,5-epimerase
MQFLPTAIADVIEIMPTVFGDERGFFMETYHQQKFADHGITADFVQDNHSYSMQHILRGLHFQTQHTQGKLVRVIEGEIFDVAVDLRQSSATFGQSVAVVLNASKKNQLWVPPGFAHGFYVMSPTAHVTYKCTDFYAAQYEQSLLWNDVELNIPWPIPAGITPQLSAKDQQGLSFSQCVKFP